MDIIYLGHSSFKISGKRASVVTDPYDPGMTGLKAPSVEAQIVTVSHNHLDHNFVSWVSGVKKVIDGPGEYEIEGISILGFPTFHDDKNGAERGKNIVFVFEVDGFRIAHLGDLGHTLSEDQINAIGDIDILLVPTGGKYTINSEKAVEVVQSIEPLIIIPMHYSVPGLKEDSFSELEKSDKFVTAIGYPSESLPKLSLKDRSLLPEEPKVYILERK
jgi:L-ascorbate metabolism protein UlaG (beta-lactamase superfamily)